MANRCLRRLSFLWIPSALVLTVLPVDATPDEDSYVEMYGNIHNVSGTWDFPNDNRKFTEKLEDVCRQAHARSGHPPGDVVFATYYTRKLEFSEKYQPIGIDMIFYLIGIDKPDGKQHYYYLTKGLKPDCLFYLKNVAPDSSFYRLDQHVCGIKME